MQLEDQEFPKKCGHFKWKKVISQAEMIGKLKAAVDTRRDEDFFVIARTDALAVLGIEAAIERAHSYVKAGADGVFIEAPHSLDEIRRIGQENFGVPKIANMV